MDVNGMVVFTKCISIACGGSMPLSFSDYARIAAENKPENILAICRVQRGSGHIALGSISTEVNSGSLLLLGSGESYTFTASENILANLIVFDRRLFSSSYAYTLGREALAPMQALARGCELITEKDACYGEVMATVDTIWRAAEAGETSSPIMAVAMLWQLAAQLKRETERRGDTLGSDPGDPEQGTAGSGGQLHLPALRSENHLGGFGPGGQHERTEFQLGLPRDLRDSAHGVPRSHPVAERRRPAAEHGQENHRHRGGMRLLQHFQFH